jgi:hypothetical protein
MMHWGSCQGIPDLQAWHSCILTQAFPPGPQAFDKYALDDPVLEMHLTTPAGKPVKVGLNRT